MFPRKNRINKEFFDIAFKNGKNFSSDYIVLKKLLIDSTKEPHFSVVFSKKIEKLAVKRNKSRRIFFNAIKTIYKENKIQPGFYIFIVRKSVLNMKFDKIVNDIDFIIKKATI